MYHEHEERGVRGPESVLPWLRPPSPLQSTFKF